MAKVDRVQKRGNLPTENVGKIKINGKWYRVKEVKQNIKITKSVKEALQNALNDKIPEKPRKFNVIATRYTTDITYGDKSKTIEDFTEKKEITDIWHAVHTKDNHPQTDHQGSSERSFEEGNDAEFDSCHTSRRGSEVSDKEVVPLPKRRSTSSGRSSESVNRDDQENPDLDNPKLQKADEYYRERELKKALSAFKMHTIKSKNKRKQNEELKKLREFNVKNHAFGLWKKETQQSALERKLEELTDNIQSLGGYPDCINFEDATENSITDRIERAKDYVNKLQELNDKCNTLLDDVSCAKGIIDKIGPNIIDEEKLFHELNAIQEEVKDKSKRYFLYEDVNKEIDDLSENIEGVNQLIQQLEDILNESERMHASPSHKEPLQTHRPAGSPPLNESAEQRRSLERKLENLKGEISYLGGYPDCIDVKDRKENSITKRIELAEDYVGKLRAIHKNITELNHKAKTADDLLSEIKERISGMALINLEQVNKIIEKINKFIEKNRISLKNADFILSDLTENINIANGIIEYLNNFNESDQSNSDEEVVIEQLSEGMTSDGDVENFLSSSSSRSIPVLPRRQHSSTDNFEFELSSCSSESESEKDQSGSFHTASESGSTNLYTPRSPTQTRGRQFSTRSENGKPIRYFSEKEEDYYRSEGAPSSSPLPVISRRSSANQRRGLPESPNGKEKVDLYLSRSNSRRYTQSPRHPSVHLSSEEPRSNRGDSSQVPRSPTNSAAEGKVSGVEEETRHRSERLSGTDSGERSRRRRGSKASDHPESSQPRRRSGSSRRGSKPSSNAASDPDVNVSGVEEQTRHRSERLSRRASDQESNSSHGYHSDVSKSGSSIHSSTTSGDSSDEE